MPGKIDGYTNSVAAGNVLPFNGVASWSTVATAANTDNVAIFDARVSVPLGALQMFAGYEAAALFLILASQNKVIKAINPLLTSADGWCTITPLGEVNMQSMLEIAVKRMTTKMLKL